MGIRIHSDICRNFIELEESIGDYKGDSSIGIKFKGWLCLETAFECGEDSEIYGSVLVKTNIFDNIEPEDLEDVEFNIESVDYPYVYLVFKSDSDDIGSIFSEDLESVREFQRDFKVSGIIKNQKSFSQSI